MAEIIEFRILEEIEKVFNVIYRSAHQSTSATDPEMAELVKPLLNAMYLESADQDDEVASFVLERLLQKAFERITMRIALSDFMERHQLARLERLCDIRSILQEYYERERRAIGFIQLWNKLKRRCDFDLSQDLLERRLHQMGFQLIHSHTGETIHEHPRQRLTRLKYLRTMRKHRDNGRTLLYFREATINFMRWNLTEKDPSRAETTEMVIAYFAATESRGLVDFMFAEKGQQTTKTFIEWLKSVAKGQAPNSIILLDLKNYDDTELTTDQLSDDDDTQTDDHVANVVAAMADQEIMFLPSNHPELNPLHSIDFQHILGGKRVTTDGNEAVDHEKITKDYLKFGVQRRLTTTTDDEWKQYFENVRKNEESFLRFEAFLDDDAISICVDDLQDSEESDVEIIEEIDDDVIHISDGEVIVL